MGDEPQEKGGEEKVETSGQEEAVETPTEPTSVRYKVGDQEIELDHATVEESLTQAAQMSQYIQRLQRDGVIDAQGNVVIKEEPKSKEPAEDLSEVEQLQKEVKELKNSQQSEANARKTNEILNKVNRTMERESHKHEITKDDADIKNLIESQVLSQYYMNPTADVAKIYSEVVRRFEKGFEKRREVYLKKKIDQPKGDGPGGSTGVTREQPWNKDDMRKGAVRKAVQERLEALQSAKEIG